MIATILGQTAFPEAMGSLTLGHYLFVSGVMFALGVIGFLTRRNLIIMFLCTEMMFQAAGIALIAFSRFYLHHTGQSFVIFVLTVAAAEAAMALALVVLLFRRRENLNAEEWAELSG
ncbi:MAG: NADH-quinone oxidoreductase subunit NuoK [Phycisphaeraceae bacterium]|nr:NADH-quinone oxidoreductase subunit NuoK [Phycisphaeraceae bacterium]MCW5755513.1 NADH-quinone oxidoreductase subunit NuoK [Phycisphaeraceae bacterium]